MDLVLFMLFTIHTVLSSIVLTGSSPRRGLSFSPLWRHIIYNVDPIVYSLATTTPTRSCRCPSSPPVCPPFDFPSWQPDNFLLRSNPPPPLSCRLLTPTLVSPPLHYLPYFPLQTRMYLSLNPCWRCQGRCGQYLPMSSPTACSSPVS